MLWLWECLMKWILKFKMRKVRCRDYRRNHLHIRKDEKNGIMKDMIEESGHQYQNRQRISLNHRVDVERTVQHDFYSIKGES